MEATTEQKDVLDAWINGSNNLLVNAKAGSGKTTLLMMLIEKCEYRALFLAYNKTIQEEITSKLEQKDLKQGKALTLHALGLMAIKGAYSKFNINPKKYNNIVKAALGSFSGKLKKYKWKDKSKLYFTLLDMCDISRMFLVYDIPTIREHAKVMGKELYLAPACTSELWQEVLRVSQDYMTNYSGAFDVDFIDMLYIPVVKELQIPIEPVYLFMDESQDMSLLQHKLVDKLLSQGSIKKWCSVGDDKQSIYLFNGALSNSFDLFREKENVQELPLSVCFRCATNIINEANEVYDILKPFKTEEGVVGTCESPEEIKDGSMVICRHNAPLIAVYFSLLRLEKSVYIKGDDVLQSVLKLLMPNKHLTIHQLEVEMLIKFNEAKASRDMSEETRIRFYRIKEEFDIFKALADNMCESKNTVIDILITKIKSLFIDKQNAIVLCSMHKSKGLEADVVYILNENLIPSPLCTGREQLIQEQNLKYVARSRAKKELYYLNY